MNLNEFKTYIESYPAGTQFNYGLSKPFSWRGSYDEVAFSILESSMTKEDILKNINLAYTELFDGYKGGEYRYNDYTRVNFEEYSRNYTDGEYTSTMIFKISTSEKYNSMEDKLVRLAFSND